MYQAVSRRKGIDMIFTRRVIIICFSIFIMILAMMIDIQPVYAEGSRPTDITLLDNIISENSSSNEVGTLSATDGDGADTFTYTLEDSTAYPDNDAFEIIDDKLLTKASFDYETKNSYIINIKVTDSGAESLEKEFTILVTDVSEAPVIAQGASMDISCSENEMASLTLSASEEDGDVMQWSVSSAAAVGTATVSGSSSGPSITIIYQPDSAGTDSFTVTADDGTGETDSILINVTISSTPINDAPVITQGDTASMNGTEDIAVIELNLTATDADHDALSWDISAAPSHGLATVSGGAVTYQPDADYNGADSFEVTVSDGHGGTDTISVSVMITAVNDAPNFTIGPDQTADEDAGDQTAAGWATGINKGADNESGQALTFVVTNSAIGLFSVQPAISSDGNLTYTPAANAHGNATVAVYLQDNGGTDNGGHDTTAVQTFTITITAENDAPVITQGDTESMNGTEDIAEINLNLAATDVDLDTLSWSISAAASHGTASMSGGAVTYQPDADYNGADSFVVMVSDGNGGTDIITVNVTIDPVNDAPSFTKGLDQTVSEDAGAQTAAGWVTGISKGAANESGQILTFVVTNSAISLFSVQPAISADGTLTYTPAANANGSATVTVYLQDNGGTENGGHDTTASQTFTIIITVVNDSPAFTLEGDKTVSEDSGATTYAGFITSALPGGGPDESGQILTYTVTNNNNSLFSVQPAISSAGTLTFTLAANANGSTSVTAFATDNDGATSPSTTFTITVTALNDAPVITQGATATMSGTEDISGISLNLSATDIDLDTLNWSISVAASHGTATVSGGAVTYTPDVNYNGADSFTVTVSDGHGGIDTIAVSVTITELNDAPTMEDIADFHIDEDSSITKDFEINDVDHIADSLIVTFETSDTALLPNANIILDGSGSSRTVTVTPVENRNGNVTVTLIVRDASGLSFVQSFTMTVDPANDAPTIGTIADRTIEEDCNTGTIGITVADIDTALTDLQLTVVSDNADLVTGSGIVTGGSGANRTLVITPIANQYGTTTITVTVSDGGLSAATTFHLTVTAADDAPTIGVLSNVTTDEDVSTGAISFTIDDIDDDEDTLTVSASAENTAMIPRANIELGGDGSNRTICLTPVANKNGTSVITISAKDSNGLIFSKSFTLTVNPVNDAPVLSAIGAQTTNEDTIKDLTITVSDLEDSALNITSSAISSNTTLVPNGNLVFTGTSASRTLRITPAANASGTADITITITDSGGLTDSKTFTITVNAVNDAPSFTLGGNQTAAEDCDTVTVSGWASDISVGPADESGQTVAFTVTNDNNSLFSVQPTISSTGVLTFKPASNASGSAEVSIKIGDDGGTTNGGSNTSEVRTFSITVTPVNDAPVAQSVSIILDTDEDKSFKGALLATDIENDALTYSIVSGSAFGTVTIKNPATGAFTYTPIENYFGNDEFTFKVNDGELDSNVTSVAIEIRGINDPPVAVSQSVTTDEDAPYSDTVSATDIDSVGLSFALAYEPEHGEVTFNINGSYTYTPDSDYYGSDYFTFRAFDGSIYSNMATVSITIMPVNDAPVAVNEAVTIYMNQDLHGVLKATDKEKDTLTYTIVSGPDHGSITSFDAGSGAFTYTPVANTTGTAVFTYKAQDSNGGISAEQTVTIMITDVNLEPALTAAIYTTPEDTALNAFISATDPNNDILTYVIVSDARYGAVTLTNTTTGAFTYTPPSNFNGTDMFTVKATDGEYYTSTVIERITVTAVNDDPTVYSQIFDIEKNTTLSGNLAGSDRDGNTLSYSASGSAINGAVSVNANGSFQFTPDEDFIGTAYFDFYSADGHGGISNTARVTIHVYGGGGGSPTGLTHIDNRTINEDTTDTLTVTLSGYLGGIIAVTSSNQGLVKDSSITITPTGTDGVFTVQMTPVLNQTGDTVITVEGKDSGGTAVDTITYVLHVVPANDAPTTSGKTLQMDQQTVLNEYLIASDPDGGALTFVITESPLHAKTFDFDTATGIFQYVPNDNYSGADSFDFQVKDSANLFSSEETVSITIRKVSRQPIASGGAFTTDEDTAYVSGAAGKLFGYDNSGDPVTFELVTDGSKGSVVITDADTGEFTYTPDADLNGADAFSFRVKGSTGLYSSTAVMNISINPVNDKPVGIQKTFTTYEDETLNGHLQGDDIEKDTLTFSIVSATSHGALTLVTTTGAFSYVPDENFNGQDRFYFLVHDGADYSDPVEITIGAIQVNDAPVASDTSINATEDVTYTSGLTLLSLVSDVDTGDTQNISIVQNGSKGTATITNASTGAFKYVPNVNENGIDYFSFKAVDAGGLSSNVSLITVNLAPVNDNPNITGAATWAINEDSSASDNLYNFIVGDIEDEASALIVTAVSGNTDLVTAGRITLGGSAADRWMRVTPVRHVSGSAVITITVADSGRDNTLSGPALTASINITLTINPVNDTPTINGWETDGHSITTVTIDEDASTDPIAFTINDEESGSVLTLSAISSNTTLVNAASGVAFGGSGSNRTVTVTPLSNKSGTVRITISVSDGNTERTAYIDVTVNPVNDAPVVTPPAVQTINEDSSTEVLYYTISDIDSNVEGITISVISSDESKVRSDSIALGGNGAERTIKITPVANANGDVNIQIFANDNHPSGINTTGQGIFTLHIIPVNDAPTIGAIANQTIDEDTETGEVIFHVNDIDSTISTLTVSAISGNTALITSGGITFGNGGADDERWIKLRPAADQNGSALITVLVNDGTKTSSTTFTLTVNPVNDTPVISSIPDQTILEDSATGVITFTVGDIDDDVTGLTIDKYSADTGVIPTGNIVIIGNGAERTVKITPLADQNGDIEIHLTVLDPHGATASAIFTLHVTPVNDTPSFTKGANKTVTEDAGAQTAAGWATGISKGPVNESGQALTFIVTNSATSLFSSQPAISSDGTLTYTPAANANGSATVSVYLQDDGGTANGGHDTTAVQTFTITVMTVNDAPTFSIAGGKAVNEDCGAQTFAGYITASSKGGGSDEAGQTLAYTVTNDNNSLFATQPAISAAGTLTFKPAANASGTATVTVTLRDNGGTANGGVNTSASQTFTITVNPVNDIPNFTVAGNKTVNEDCGDASYAGFITASSPGGGSDEAGQTLSYTVTNSAMSLFSVQPEISSGGALTFTPEIEAYGSATVSVYLQDNGGTANGGQNTTAAQTFTITINPVNDAPTFTKGADQTVTEDTGAQAVAGWATGISKGPANESGQTVTFMVTNSAITLFSVQPAISSDGTLTYTPAANANGTATITVYLQDNGGTANGGHNTSVSQTFTITITAVNDPPHFDLTGNRNVLEDEAAQNIVGFTSSISAGGGVFESLQTLTFTTTNNNHDLFIVQPEITSSGALIYTLAANVNGSAEVTVTLEDSGGGTNSYTTSFAINVTAVNDAPTFTMTGDKTVNEDSGDASYAGFITASSQSGGTDEAGQTLTYIVTNSAISLFSMQPAISADGRLTFTPAADANGSATVTVNLQDNGGTANGGHDTSSAQTFTIIINPVNDVPDFTKGSDQTVAEDSGAQTVAGWATGIIKGPDNESGQAMTFVVTNSAITLFSVQPSISSDGTLTYTPAANANGSATVTVYLQDSGGTANGGQDITLAQTFTITVTAVNDAPDFELIGNRNVLEDEAAQNIAGYASNISAGGGALEASQTLGFITTNDNHGLFSEQPEITSSGALIYTLAADANGSATVTVKLTDSGDGTNSFTTTFAINVTAVNDAPCFTGGGNVTVGENTGAKTVAGWTSDMSKGPANESGQTLSFVVTNNSNSLFSSQPTISSSGALTFTPASDASGTATVTVYMQDNGGTANGGINTSAPVIFTIKVIDSDELSVKGYVKKSVDLTTSISGATITLIDMSGAVKKTTTTDANGYYELTGVTEGRYLIEVTHPSYADNNRMTEVSFDAAPEGVVQEDFLMADFTLELSANPSAIIGNGTDSSLLTAVVKDRNGNPISDVTLTFSAEEGTFLGGIAAKTTDADGTASVTYISADHSGSLNEINVPVTVTVNDPAKGLYGSDRIYVTFAPGVIEGIVTDGNPPQAIEGAIVKVFKDFDGDGITDFSFEQVTGADGKYRIIIPRGGVDYDILITKPVTIGESIQWITVKQVANPGAIGASGATFDSERAASGIIVLKKNGTDDLVTNLASYAGMKILLVDALGNIIDISGKFDSTLGTFTTATLTPGAYTIRIVYDLGGGEQLIAGSTDILITMNGEMNINEVLIDPYGTIRDSVTGTKLSGVKVELYYATSGAIVPLPALAGFPPSNNANPQFSDANGEYAFMVFPDTDYYIKASKAGYLDFVSGTISVGKAIVLYNFNMTPSAVSGGAGGGGSAAVPEESGKKDLGISISAEKMKVEENSNVSFTIIYGNKTSTEITKNTITAVIPDGMTISDRAGGTVSGNIISWNVPSLAGGERNILTFTLKAGSLNEAGVIKEIAVKITSEETLDNTEDDASFIKVLLYSNRFEGIHERFMKGYPDMNFNSDRNITRAEISAIFARLLKLDLTLTEDPFKDVSQNHWAAGYIQSVAKAGLLTGYDNGSFAPDQYITRAELATVIARYFDIERSTAIVPLENHFSDTEESWADGSIEEVYRFDIATGYDDGTFRPANNILRSETVTMINRMLYRGPVANGEQRFLDTYPTAWYFQQVEEATKTHKYIINEDGSETVTEWIDDDLQ